MALMIRTGLDFAPGTTDANKQLVGRLFEPAQLYGAYKAARQQFGTGDIVLSVSEQDPSGFEANTRAGYIRRIKAAGGGRVPMLMGGLVEKSAQAIVRLPFESDAMWLIIVRGPKEVPVMCVLHATPYEVESPAAAVS
jgi:hypothetical protein